VCNITLCTLTNTTITMPNAPHDTVLYSFPTTGELTQSVAQFILKAQKESIDKHDKFTVAISGGSLPKTLTALIGNPAVKWEKWCVCILRLINIHLISLSSRQVYFADERVVPLDHEDSNYKLALDTLFSKVSIPSSHIHPIDTSLLDDLEELADSYEKELIHEFAQKDSARFPVFDLILLGTGPDGHTASLFPGHELLAEEDRWIAYIEDSPKPPPKRITLTYPVINHAARVAFVATGESKKDILHDILDEPEKGLPSSRVRPAAPGYLYWFVDDAASSRVKYKRSEFKV
jgi:6-phosphogluconolactonase